MKKQTKLKWQKPLFAVIATVILMFATSASVAAQGKFKVGDKVECDAMGIGRWEKGTIVAYSTSDDPETAGYCRFSSDRYPKPEGSICPIAKLRPLTTTTTAPKENPREQPKEIGEKEIPADKEKPNETKAGRFKVGDRVKACDIQLDDYPPCWRNATIIKDMMAEEGFDSYQVLTDDPRGGKGTLAYVPPKYIRANGTKPDRLPLEAKLRVDEDGTVLVGRELLDCDNIEQKPTKNGARPDAKLLEKLIRCLYERPAEKGLDGARTVDLTPLQIGAPRKWIAYQDIGSGGTPDTLVYAVKTTFTWRTFYRSRIQEDVSVGVFNCYVNTFGEWQCGSAGSKQKGETKDIPVQQ